MNNEGQGNELTHGANMGCALGMMALLYLNHLLQYGNRRTCQELNSLAKLGKPC